LSFGGEADGLHSLAVKGTVIVEEISYLAWDKRCCSAPQPAALLSRRNEVSREHDYLLFVLQRTLSPTGHVLKDTSYRSKIDASDASLLIGGIN